MRLSAGARFGHYQIHRLLGAGGMGEVYCATDTRLGREIALKILRSEVSTDSQEISRFHREARSAAALNHPNIATLFSVEENDGVHFLTMELVDGRPLDELIPPEGFPADRVLELAAPLAQAIAAAHNSGLVHRDLKPANIMVTTDGRVKVLDFGLARNTRPAGPETETSTSLQVTQQGVVVGTPLYMSPEQISGADVDQRSDVFSLGIILYEMLTGCRPFQGSSAAELAASILRDTPARVSKPGVPAALVTLIDRCLAKAPGARPHSAQILAADLRDIMHGSAPVSRPEPSPADERFSVAIVPFTFRGSDETLQTVAEGLTAEINTGLSRLSYLRVVAAGPSDTGARYVLDGSIRRAGARLRVTVQLHDRTKDVQLWVETYERAFDPDAIFDLQDDLVPRIVSTCADPYGVLPRSIGDLLRGTDPAGWSPYDALLHFFGYHQRLIAADHLAARTGLERAVGIAPGNADCWAALSLVYSHESGHGFNALPHAVDRAHAAARRALDIAPGNDLAHQAMSTVLLFRKELVAAVHEAERAIQLNPLSGGSNAAMGSNIAFAGNWERGCALIEWAMELNPQHPVWYRGVLALKAYVTGNYRSAVDEAVKANAPYVFWLQVILAAAHGQLDEQKSAAAAVSAFTELLPGFAANARAIGGTWLQTDDLEHLLQGLMRAGVRIEEPAASRPS